MSCAVQLTRMSTRTDHSTASSSPSPPSSSSTAVVSDVEQTRKGNFFSMFFMPSAQLYDDDMHHILSASTSSYLPIKAAASAASNMIGGILSVIDTAIAAMNEEIENTSESFSSGNTKDSEDHAPLLSEDSCTRVDADSMMRGSMMRCNMGVKELSIAIGDTDEENCGSGK